MQFSYQCSEDFIDEVKVYLAAKEIEENLVRLQIESQASRDGGVVAFAVRAGFIRANGDLHQYYEQTGISPCKPADVDGEESAAKIREFLKDACMAAGAVIRKGHCVG